MCGAYVLTPHATHLVELICGLRRLLERRRRAAPRHVDSKQRVWCPTGGWRGSGGSGGGALLHQEGHVTERPCFWRRRQRARSRGVSASARAMCQPDCGPREGSRALGRPAERDRRLRVGPRRPPRRQREDAQLFACARIVGVATKTGRAGSRLQAVGAPPASGRIDRVDSIEWFLYGIYSCSYTLTDKRRV